MKRDTPGTSCCAATTRSLVAAAGGPHAFSWWDACACSFWQVDIYMYLKHDLRCVTLVLWLEFVVPFFLVLLLVAPVLERPPSSHER